jgi:BirA family biotin operon repressor/biotin-[acetyl-CoA-carboxylase] ligase
MHVKDLDSRLAALAAPRTRNLGLFESLDSTNALAKRIARHYQRIGLEAPRFLILALQQTAGRGRLGNTWSSPAGGIYLSIVTSVDPSARLDWLPLRAAVHLCLAVDELIDATCLIKWPNDLVVEGRKIGGVLLETVGNSDGVAVAIGVGLNHSPDEALLPAGATSVVSQSSRPASFSVVVDRLMAALEASTERSEEPERVVEEYARRSVHQSGQKLRCRTPQDECEGTFLGFDGRGFLQLRTLAGDRLIAAGEIIEREDLNHEGR